MPRLCLFCGSNAGARPIYLESARALGAALAARNIGFVYGGSSIGLMGAAADAVVAGGGEAYGVIPRSMVDREIAHRALTELHVVETMHERKAKMVSLSDAFVAMPGGNGTLDELFEVLTWAQLGIHAKPIALWDVDGYWQPLIAAVDHAVREGFVKPVDRARLLVCADLDELLRTLFPS
jgi:uncharacterized protein (TIGR00730 family)